MYNYAYPYPIYTTGNTSNDNFGNNNGNNNCR